MIFSTRIKLSNEPKKKRNDGALFDKILFYVSNLPDDKKWEQNHKRKFVKEGFN